MECLIYSLIKSQWIKKLYWVAFYFSSHEREQFLFKVSFKQKTNLQHITVNNNLWPTFTDGINYVKGGLDTRC